MRFLCFMAAISKTGLSLSLPRSPEQECSLGIHDYDIVYGPIANDKVEAQIRNVMEQNINMDTFLERLKYIKGIIFSISSEARKPFKC